MIIVAINIEPVKEIINDGETGFLVEKGDYKCLTERMKFVIANLDEFNETIANNAYRLVKRDFSIEAYIKKLQTIYASVIYSFSNAHISSDKRRPRITSVKQDAEFLVH